MTREDNFMMEAIKLSIKGMRENDGGPFGCVIVRGDKIIGRGNNKVISTNDPTAHAEVVAIRDACKNAGTFQLNDCEIYTSCEPCPMCLGAIYWTNPKAIYYANTRIDAEEIGFSDALIYEEFNKKLEERIIPIQSILRKEAIKVFKEWKDKDDKIIY
jgi:tRNA(Arg) A34 adenosine deaminase TadA